MIRHHDVIIVGAGPVGLLLGCLLAQEGVDAVVLERREGQDTRTRAIGVHPPGMSVLDAAEIGGAARAEALALEGGDVFSRGRRLASVDFSAERRVHVLPQPVTTRLLDARLHALAPDSLERGSTVSAVREEGDRVRVSIARDGHRHERTASLVVAADGVRSATRSSIDAGWQRRPGRATYAMVDVQDPSAPARAGLYCEPEGLVESFPLPKGGRRWVIRLPDDPRTDALTALTADALGREIERRIGIRPDIPHDAATSVFRAAQHLAAPVSRRRIVLLGDAAHEISPIGGQGMNLGWVEARRLADAIVRGGAGRSVDVDAHERAVRRSARAAQRRSAFYMAMGSPGSAAAMSGRAVLIRALGSAPLRKWTSGLITMQNSGHTKARSA